MWAGAKIPNPWIQFWITVGVVLASIGILVIAYFSTPPNALILAIFAGGVGGIVHEFAQSGGRVAFPDLKEDGIYLGALSGLFLGMAAAFILFDPAQPSYIILTQSLLAGLGLKGVTEAVGGQVIQKVQGTFTIENVARDVPTNSLTLTVRNTGSVSIDIDQVYVDTQQFQRRITIHPENASNIQVSPIIPPITQISRHTIKVVTTKGLSQTIAI